VAIRYATITEATLKWTVEYTCKRRAFGKAIADFQNSQFKLAETKSDVLMLRVFIDKGIELLINGRICGSS